MSSCCDDKPKAAVHVSRGLNRRALLRRLTAGAGAVAAAASLPAYAAGQRTRLKLAFCSQLLCVVPYEVTRAAGFFADEGLDVELVYSRGGGAALQALNAGAVDYAATSLDAALNAFANKAAIVRFADTGRLPLFALATSPKTADEITDIKVLQGKTIGVASLGNADHALSLYLLKRSGVDPDTVRFATLGPNLYDALRLGQVDAGMVQEPGLTLLQREGADVLANMMDLKDADKYLGGPYTFMGVAVRSDEVQKRQDEMKKMGKALAAGLRYTRDAPLDEVIDMLPEVLVAGGDIDVLSAALGEHRESLYPDRVQIDLAANRRVMDIQVEAGALKAPVDLNVLLDPEVLSA